MSEFPIEVRVSELVPPDVILVWNPGAERFEDQVLWVSSEEQRSEIIECWRQPDDKLKDKLKD